jgi:hypothetical protein
MISRRLIRLRALVIGEKYLFRQADETVVVATHHCGYSAGADTALAHHSVVSP